MKKVLITGATGFIGSALAKRLMQSGVTVIAVDINAERLSELKQFGDVIPIVAEFKDYRNLASIVDEKDIDVFYHFAWQGVFGEAFKDYELQLCNAKYACDATAEAIELGCKKFVYAQTSNVFEIITFLQSETFAPRYTNIYSASKTAGELIGKTLAYNNGMEYVSGAICMAYGEGNRSQMLANVILKQLMQNVEPKLIEGNNLYDMIYVDDIAGAFEAIGKRGINQKTYYIGHRKLRPFRKWIIDMRDAIAPKLNLKFGEYKDEQNIDYNLVDLDALYNDTGFEAKTDFKESIVKTAEWIATLNG
jgi:nucleoside-diphosphate-sugar epimerase